MVRNSAARSESDRLRLLRTKIQAATVIQRAWRRYKFRMSRPQHRRPRTRPSTRTQPALHGLRGSGRKGRGAGSMAGAGSMGEPYIGQARTPGAVSETKRQVAALTIQLWWRRYQARRLGARQRPASTSLRHSAPREVRRRGLPPASSARVGPSGAQIEEWAQRVTPHHRAAVSEHTPLTRRQQARARKVYSNEGGDGSKALTEYRYSPKPLKTVSGKRVDRPGCCCPAVERCEICRRVLSEGAGGRWGVRTNNLLAGSPREPALLEPVGRGDIVQQRP